MPYELRVNDRIMGHYETPDEAERLARDLIRADADTKVDIIDRSTGRAYGPASNADDRDALARKIGF